MLLELMLELLDELDELELDELDELELDELELLLDDELELLLDELELEDTAFHVIGNRKLLSVVVKFTMFCHGLFVFGLFFITAE